MKYGIIKLVIVLTIAILILPQIGAAQSLVPCGRTNDVLKKDAAGQIIKPIEVEPQKFCTLPDFIGLLISIVNIALELSGLVAVAMVVLGGLKMTSAGISGKAELFESGKKTVTLAILGFILILAAFMMVNIIWTTVLDPTNYDWGKNDKTWSKPWQ